MTIPMPPWWIKLLDGGNARSAAVGAVCFCLGYMFGESRKNHWHDVSRSGDSHWRKEYGWGDGHHGKHTEREHERGYDKHKHGEGYGR